MSWFSYAILAAFFASLSVILEKKTLENVHSFDFSILLALFAACITAPVMISAPWETLSPALFVSIFCVSLIIAAAHFSVTKGLRHLEVSVASPILLLTPLITTLLAYGILGETVSMLQMLGMAVLILGLYILETHQLSAWRDFFEHISGSEYTRYVLMGVLLYGFSSIFDRVILATYHVPPEVYVAIIQTFLAGIFLVWACTRTGAFSSIKITLQTHWQSILLVAIFTTAFRTLQAHAVALTAVGIVIAVKRSSALFTTIIGGELFHESNLLRKSIACGIMISGVYLLAIG